MIYTATLNVQAKKALGKQSMQSTFEKIVENMLLDPDTTTMDTVILAPEDLRGPKQAKMQDAVSNRHPDICVIYLYTKDADADKLECDYKKKVKAIKEAAIKEAAEQFIGKHTIRSGRQAVSSADFVTPEKDTIETSSVPKRGFFSRKKKQAPVQIDDEEIEEESVGQRKDPRAKEEEEPELEGDRMSPEELLNMFDGNNAEEEPKEVVEDVPPLPDIPPLVQEPEMPESPIDTSTVVSEPMTATEESLPPVPEAQGTIEDYLASVNSIEEWTIFKEHLTHDSIVRKLIAENSEYAGLVNMLDVLDTRIKTVWRDSALTSTQKFERIKAIGLERATIRATTNSINVEKAISIISTIILSAKRTVEEMMSTVDSALYKITTDGNQIADTSVIDAALAERTKIQMNLLNAAKQLVDLYVSIDNFVTDEILELDKKLPSNNDFINNMVNPSALASFTPTNTANLANSLAKALQQNRIVASQLEEQINAVIQQLFALCSQDEKLIHAMYDKINLLKANRVEDVIIVDTLLKNCMRLFVGSDNSGRSSTAITWCGVLSRRQNTLLIDLTGRAKFKDYGIDSVPLAEFMTTRIEQPFLCVESASILSPEYVQNLIDQLKSRLNYYSSVNVIVAPEDENGLDQLSTEAICVHYITNCSTQSMNEMHKVFENHKSENIARKLIIIDTPVSPLMIADNIGVDATIVQLVTIPNVPAMRACALRHDRPYEYEDVLRIYEEAIR